MPETVRPAQFAKERVRGLTPRVGVSIAARSVERKRDAGNAAIFQGRRKKELYEMFGRIVATVAVVMMVSAGAARARPW